MKAVGVAQGTFYYYFDSKTAVLQAIVAQMMNQILTNLQEIIADDTLTVVPKWQQMIQLSNDWKIERKAELVELLLNPDQHDDPTTVALQKNAAVQTAVERLLGAPTGSMPIIDDDTLIAWFAD